MKTEIAFVNFPANKEIRENLTQRIEQRIQKYQQDVTNIRVFLKNEGHLHHIKFHLTSPSCHISVTAVAENAGKALEQALQRLESAMRKILAKRKLKRNNIETPWFEQHATSSFSYLQSDLKEETWHEESESVSIAS